MDTIEIIRVCSFIFLKLCFYLIFFKGIWLMREGIKKMSNDEHQEWVRKICGIIILLLFIGFSS